MSVAAGTWSELKQSVELQLLNFKLLLYVGYFHKHTRGLKVGGKTNIKRLKKWKICSLERFLLAQVAVIASVAYIIQR